MAMVAFCVVPYIEDGQLSTYIVFIDGVWRGTKLINLKEIADGAIEICEQK